MLYHRQVNPSSVVEAGKNCFFSPDQSTRTYNFESNINRYASIVEVECSTGFTTLYAPSTTVAWLHLRILIILLCGYDKKSDLSVLVRRMLTGGKKPLILCQLAHRRHPHFRSNEPVFCLVLSVSTIHRVRTPAVPFFRFTKCSQRRKPGYVMTSVFPRFRVHYCIIAIMHQTEASTLDVLLFFPLSRL